jgi:hypothetical protein
MSFDNSIGYTGDYKLRNIVLINDRGERVPLPSGLVQQFSIYEDINKSALTGTMTILDNLNLINTVPLMGSERLAFTLMTPGTTKNEHIIDASEKTGYPFHIYRLSDVKHVAEGIQNYILHFGSRDFINNLRMRVSQAYEGPLHAAALAILKDPMGLNTPRAITYEPTLNKDKVVIPNLRPLDAVKFLANRSLSKNSNSAGYYFYETTKGFHFRSYESMLSLKGKHYRDEKLILTYQPKGVKAVDQAEKNLFNVDSYEFVQHFDTATNQAQGTYANRVILHNIFDKSFTPTEQANYDYLAHFHKHFHADSVGTASMHNYPVSTTPVDESNKNYISSFPEGYVTLQPTTQFLHGNNSLYSGSTSVTDLLAIAGKSAASKYDMSDEDKKILSTLASIGGVGGLFGILPETEAHAESTRISQRNQVANTNLLKITMAGHTYLEVGDVIYFQLPAVEKNKGTGRLYSFDEHHAGRYLVTTINHLVQGPYYKMVLGCVKDSVYRHYIPSQTHTTSALPKDKIANLYTEDEKLMGAKASPGHPSNR